jgi:hypothetical protein
MTLTVWMASPLAGSGGLGDNNWHDLFAGRLVAMFGSRARRYRWAQVGQHLKLCDTSSIFCRRNDRTDCSHDAWLRKLGAEMRG